MTIRRRYPQRATRGFTLVELMVALSGGLFLSMTVFALARDTSRFYQRENRVANATLAGLVGFERLKADIARAGYMTTPNITRDPRLCMNPAAGWPAMMQTLASLRINPDTPVLGGNAAMAANGTTPDEIVMAGSYFVTDQFPLRDATGNTLMLQITAPLVRLGYLAPAITPAQQTTLLANVFRTGRVLRLTDKAGLQYYGRIANVAGGPQPTITLNAAPALVYAGSGQSCGIEGRCTGCMVNVVNFIRYQIRDLRADGYARFAPLWAAAAGAPGEATRTELVRQELATDGTVFETPNDLSTELIAEYAVDLGFSVTVDVTANGTAAVDAQPGSPNFQFAFNPGAGVVGNPQRVRAVRTRLSVRSREGDRGAAIAGGLYRFRLPDGLPNNQWARVRTFQADIGLRNQEDVRW